MRFPYFSRAQQGVILLLGAAMLLLWAWRANLFLTPSPLPTPKPLNPVFVEVRGAVAHPGVYPFPQAPTLAELWQKAGGPGTAPAALVKITSGCQVEIDPEGRYRLGRMEGAHLLTLGLALDLNAAGVQDLDALPGIGPALAQRIIDFRRKHGPFKKIDALELVSGIGPKKLEKIKPHLVIDKNDDHD